MEKVIEIKNCKQCNARFEITDKDLEFYEKVSPIFNLETGLGKERLVSDNELIIDLWNWKVKYLIPAPTLCPDCRQQRRLSFRNERNLYRRKCDATGKDIVSIYSPDKLYKVYNQDFWRGNKWNSLDYGRNFDFSKRFSDQYQDLLFDVPRIDKLVMNSVNCNYNNIMWNCKDCYMCSTTFQSESCIYSYRCVESKNNVDVDSVWRSTNLYECLNCNNCYNIFFSENSIDSSDSWFLYNCSWCSNCFLCSNLNNKEYCILNEQYSKDSYNSRLIELRKNDLKYLFRLFDDLKSDTIRENLVSKNVENSFWDYIFNCNNCVNCFNVTDWENIKHCFDSAVWLKDCMDMSMIWDVVELMYEAHASWYNWYKSSFINLCWNWSELLYCDYCMYCSNCFWCVWLKNKSYCILNRQYSKKEYNKLVPKIIEHMIELWEWWEFFPSTISPFWYNETVAEEYFPLDRSSVIPAKVGIYSKEEVIKKYNDSEISKSNNSNESFKSFREFIDSWTSQEWQLFHWNIFNWSDYESPKPKVDKIIPASKLPEDISEIPDDILNWAIECEITKKPFRIIREELEFYRKHNLPIPRRHPDQRHLDRMKLRNPRKLYDRKCDKCSKEIKTTYYPDRPEIVYCEECYNKQVY